MNPYYTPYNSDDTDTDNTDTDGDNTDADNTEDIRIRREQDPRYAIIRKADANLNTPSFKYMENSQIAEYKDTNVSYKNAKYLDPPKTTTTTLFCIKSLNRDNFVYPSAFNYQITLPRVYKNVTKFQLVQLSFPYNTDTLKNSITLVSSFYNFAETNGYNPSCISSCINVFTYGATSDNSFGMMEQGRLTPTGSQMLTTLRIPEGKFNNNQIASFLNSDANSTPPFNLISYDDFKAAFKVTRDITLLFNEPGDNYKSKLSSNNYTHHTKETIMNMYYSQHDIDKHSIITDIIAFNAYYFPVLKELIVTELGFHFIKTDLTIEELKYNVLNNFLGLDSALYYELCSNNIISLNEFRKNLTFEYRNINKYNWIYDDKLKRFSCNHETLHTSLKRDINNSLHKFISEELQINSLNVKSFNTLKKMNMENNTVLDHLQSNLSSVFNSYFLESNCKYNGCDSYSSDSYNDSYSGNVVRSFSELHKDDHFTNMFNYTSTFGRQYGTYIGNNISFTNFLDYHSTISSYYNIVESTSNSISTINGNIYNKHHMYISSKYTNVMPSDMIKNKSYTLGQSLPVAFVGNTLNVPGISADQSEYESCLSTCISAVTIILKRYYSCLPVNTVIHTLDYKLGIHGNRLYTFDNQITFFSAVSTFNYDFFLQINPELPFNHMDISMPENHAISNETTGQTKLMYAKILTSGLGAGETSQTCIQNPILFTNTLGKLDKLNFKIYLDDESLTPMWLYSPFPSQLDEWSATFQIDEEIGFVDRNNGWSTKPTIPISESIIENRYTGIVPK